MPNRVFLKPHPLNRSYTHLIHHDLSLEGIPHTPKGLRGLINHCTASPLGLLSFQLLQASFSMGDVVMRVFLLSHK